jgi:hypothetical protein
MPIGIDIADSRELQAAVLGLRRAEKDMQRQIRQQTQAKLLPEWTKGLAEHAVTRLEHRVLVQTGRVRMSNQNVRLSSGTVGRKLSGGLQPKKDTGAVEFGADRTVVRSYDAVSRRGRRYKVRNRHTRNQLRSFAPKGHVVYPTARDLIPRFAALWVQTVVRSFYEGLEGK